MSEPQDNIPQPLSRWVKAKVVGDDEPSKPPEDPQAAAPESPQRLPPITDDELAGARWFAIAFLIVIVPLGLIVLALIIWAAVTNLRFE
jgi:hypothetical protein